MLSFGTRRSIREGNAARDRRDWPAAAAAYRRAILSNPSLARVWVQYGHCMKETGDLANAEAAYRTALTLGHDIADSYEQLGHLLKRLGRAEEAKAAFQSATERKDDSPSTSRRRVGGLLDAIPVPSGRLGRRWIGVEPVGRRRRGAVAEGSFEESVLARLEHLERLSHGGRATYVGNNRILTRCVFGEQVISYLVEADDRLIGPYLISTGFHDQHTTRFLMTHVRPGQNCLDVGANFGYFTCLMASLNPTGRVIGIEPDRHVFDLLRDNIYINVLQNTAVARHAAIADRTGKITLHRRVTRSGNTSIMSVAQRSTEALGEPVAEPFEIACLRIDDLLPEFGGRLDLVKIDVEGAEPLVLRGAAEAVRSNPQLKIVMEWEPGQIRSAGFDIGEFVREIGSLGLRPMLITPEAPVPMTLETLVNHPPMSSVLLTPAADGLAVS